MQENSVWDEYLPWSQKMQLEFKIQYTGYDEDEKGELEMKLTNIDFMMNMQRNFLGEK